MGLEEPYPGVFYDLRLNKDTFYPGDDVIVTLIIINNSSQRLRTVEGGGIFLEGPGGNVIISADIPPDLSMEPGQAIGPLTQKVWTIPRNASLGQYMAMIRVKSNVGEFSKTISFRVIERPKATMLFLAVSSYSVGRGESLEVRGSISPSPGVVDVVLQYSVDGVKWETVAKLKTNPLGLFSYRWTPPEGSYVLRALWRGNEKYAGASSTLVPVVIGSQEASKPLLVEKTVTLERTVTRTVEVSDGFPWLVSYGFVGIGAVALLAYVFLRPLSRMLPPSRRKLVVAFALVDVIVSGVTLSALMVSSSFVQRLLGMLASFGFSQEALTLQVIYLLLVGVTTLGLMVGVALLLWVRRSRQL